MSEALFCSRGRIIVFFAVSLAFFNYSWGLDLEKYIGVDEIKRGMDAYCLTVYEGAKIERFEMEVVSVIYNQMPGRDAILVVGTDERLEHTGPVKGCSGSPLYIDGRLAGALSAGWGFSKDPLYIVTPIKDMLKSGGDKVDGNNVSKTAIEGLGVDFSEPIDLVRVSEVFWEDAFVRSSGSEASVCRPLLAVTSLPAEVCGAFSARFGSAGIVAVSGGGTGGHYGDADVTGFKPGGVLGIPLVSGDISILATGTTTEVVDGRVYGFGHPFLGHGEVDLPMVSGFVHTVVSSLNFSFKLASSGPIRGAIRGDDAFGVYGKVGAQAKLIPLRIAVDRFGDPEGKRVYECQLAVNQFYTPAVLQVALVGAGQMLGPLGPDHVVRYKGRISLDKFESLDFANVSSGQSLMEVASEAMGAVSLLMNNPFGKVKVTGLDFEINIGPENLLANVRSVEVSDRRVKAGATIKVSAMVESHMSKKSTYEFSVKLPEKLAAGKYEMMVGGGYEYSKFLRKIEPYKFIAKDVSSLVSAIRYILSLERDRLYSVVTLGVGGVVVDEAELVDLPASKAVLMSSGKRTTTSRPYRHRLEQDMGIGAVVSNSKVLQLVVEE